MEQLKSVLPDLKQRALFYDMNDGDTPPTSGQYLVSIGKNRKPGTVYQVIEIKKVNSIVYSNRYKLKVFSVPEMLPFVKVGFRFDVTVMGERAFGIVWYSRNKKR